MMAGLIGLAGVIVSFFVFMDYGGEAAFGSLFVTLVMIVGTVKSGTEDVEKNRR